MNPPTASRRMAAAWHQTSVVPLFVERLGTVSSSAPTLRFPGPANLFYSDGNTFSAHGQLDRDGRAARTVFPQRRCHPGARGDVVPELIGGSGESFTE